MRNTKLIIDIKDYNVTDDIKDKVLLFIEEHNKTSSLIEKKKIKYKIWRILNIKRLRVKRNEWHAKNKIKMNNYSSVWQKNNRDKMNLYSRKYRNKYPDKDYFYMKNGHLRRKYNMSIDDYNKMCTEQEWRCKLCLKPLTRTTKNDVVDHCHKTGKVRGILHRMCNTLLGHCQDEIENLELAINYLKMFKWKK